MLTWAIQLISASSILSSKPYRFLVGPQKREYVVHASLVAAQSPALGALVHGKMKEAVNGCTVCEDVSEKTFSRFGQFLYTGNYEGEEPFEPPAPESEPLVSDPEALGADSKAAEPRHSYDSGGDFWGTNSKKKPKKKKKGELFDEFEPAQPEDSGAITQPKLEFRELFASYSELSVAIMSNVVERLD